MKTLVGDPKHTSALHQIYVWWSIPKINLHNFGQQPKLIFPDRYLLTFITQENLNKTLWKTNLYIIKASTKIGQHYHK